MKVSDADIRLLPGLTNADPEHWLSRWEAKLSTARRVDQADWQTPILDDWVQKIETAAEAADRPLVFVAHSCGVIALVHAAANQGSAVATKTRGAFLVAPPDLATCDIWPAKHGGFHPVPLVQLPFPTELVASETDPYCSIGVARDLADAWGSRFRYAGDSGHLNVASGHGPWPEGTLAFAHFLKAL